MSDYYSFITEDVINNVRKHYNVSKEDIRDKVQTIKAWLKEHKHLPQVLGDDDSLIEKFLLSNKFDVEKTKTKIDSHYKIRGSDSELADVDDTFLPSKEWSSYLFTKCLTPQYEQIVIVCSSKENKFDCLRCLQSELVCCELNLRNSYPASYIYIFDCKHTTFNIWRKIGFALTLRFLKYYFSSSYGRLSQVHVINAPYVAHIIIRFIQPFIKRKLFQRMVLHQNLESLYKMVPPKLLPKDYGGEQISIEESLELLNKFIEENRSLIREIKLQVTNEELRHS